MVVYYFIFISVIDFNLCLILILSLISGLNAHMMFYLLLASFILLYFPNGFQLTSLMCLCV